MNGSARLILAFIPCGLLVPFIWSRPDFLISSDTLLPATLTWDLLHHHNAWSYFQQARVPSFFPDLTLFGTFQAVTGGWRLAMGLWVAAIIGWLIVIATWLASRIAQTTIGVAAICCATIIVPLLAIGVAEVEPSTTLQQLGNGPLFPYLIILLPFTHGGPFLLAITTAAFALAPSKAARLSRLLVLGILAFLTSLSDLLVVVSLLLPLTASLLSGVGVGTVTKRHFSVVAGASWAGGLLGWMTAQTLDRQPMPYPPLAQTPHYAYRWFVDLERHPVMILALAMLFIMVTVDLWRQGLRGWMANPWSVFAAASGLLSLLVMVLLYGDIWFYRYALPFLWWPVIMVIAGLAKLLESRRLTLASAMPLGLATAMVLVLLPLRSPALFNWQSPLAVCLTKHDLHAGLAQYWTARMVTASTDWKLQVNQITPWGTAYVWGSDRAWFSHDIHDVSLNPQYDFIVMDDLDRSNIEAIYGAPNDTLTCGTSIVWLYENPGQIMEALLAASEPHVPPKSALALK